MKKLTINIIKDEFKKENYELLSTIYINNTQKLEFICPQNHQETISWGSWKNGRRCKKCGIDKAAKKNRTNLNDIKLLLNNEKYILLSKTYTNCFDKFKYQCPKGHINSINLHNWKKGHRCPECNNRRKYTIDEITIAFQKENYRLLSSNYKNNKQKLKFICPESHIGEITWDNWNNKNQRCAVCSHETGSKKQQIDKHHIVEFFQKENYEILNIQRNNPNWYITFKCPQKHINTTRWGDFQQGHRCRSCSHIESSAEKELYDFIKTYINNIKRNNRILINPYELDIIIPDKKIAIEYCGLYWHSENKGKTKNYHLNKLRKCNKKGYNLITIFEDEWLHKKEIVKKRLSYLLNLEKFKTIHARKCEIKEIDAKKKNKFLNDFHMQGKDNSKIKLGAFYNNTLVSVMTFSQGNASKGSLTEKNIYELNRFCSDYNYKIPGIASKLLKYFIRNYNPAQIYSYADRRWSVGDVYQQLGFKFVHNTSPNYWYIVGDKRYHRFNFRKSELPKKLENFNPELTEYQNMLNNNYSRIWDCGNSKWIYIKERI